VDPLRDPALPTGRSELRLAHLLEPNPAPQA